MKRVFRIVHLFLLLLFVVSCSEESGEQIFAEIYKDYTLISEGNGQEVKVRLKDMQAERRWIQKYGGGVIEIADVRIVTHTKDVLGLVLDIVDDDTFWIEYTNYGSNKDGGPQGLVRFGSPYSPDPIGWWESTFNSVLE